MGKFVLMLGLALDPHGAVLSTSAAQTLSSGHIKAAGPISSFFTAETAATATARAAKMRLQEAISDVSQRSYTVM